MPKYVKTITFTTKFAGDDVVATMKPLRFSDLMRLQTKSGDGEIALLSEFLAMLPDYVQSFSGAVDAEGNPVTVADLDSAYFAGLVGDMMVALLNAATITDPT